MILNLSSNQWINSNCFSVIFHNLQLSKVSCCTKCHSSFKKINKDTQSCELLVVLLRGNHQLAINDPAQLCKLITKVVDHSFYLPVLKETVQQIKGGAAQPLDLVTQYTLNADGFQVEKSQLTQGLSFCPLYPLNANNNCIAINAYPNMVYRWCLLHIFHLIVVMRQHNPKLSPHLQIQLLQHLLMYGTRTSGISQDHNSN